jgi:hypothetical protein
MSVLIPLIAIGLFVGGVICILREPTPVCDEESIRAIKSFVSLIKKLPWLAVAAAIVFWSASESS